MVFTYKICTSFFFGRWGGGGDGGMAIILFNLLFIFAGLGHKQTVLCARIKDRLTPVVWKYETLASDA